MDSLNLASGHRSYFSMKTSESHRSLISFKHHGIFLIEYIGELTFLKYSEPCGEFFASMNILSWSVKIFCVILLLIAILYLIITHQNEIYEFMLLISAFLSPAILWEILSFKFYKAFWISQTWSDTFWVKLADSTYFIHEVSIFRGFQFWSKSLIRNLILSRKFDLIKFKGFVYWQSWILQQHEFFDLLIWSPPSCNISGKLFFFQAESFYLYRAFQCCCAFGYPHTDSMLIGSPKLIKKE